MDLKKCLFKQEKLEEKQVKLTKKQEKAKLRALKIKQQTADRAKKHIAQATVKVSAVKAQEQVWNQR